MELRKIILGLGIISLTGFTSCQDNKQNETEAETTEMMEQERMEQERMERERQERERTSVSARVRDNQELSTFSMGMTRAELTDDFSEGEGPFTIFAPSNTAYEGLSREQRDQLENSEDVSQAGASTNYLVVERELTSDSLRQSIRNVGGNLELITMQGERLVATLQGEDIVLRDGSGNTATITQPDTDASNGVVHVIDNVLQPVDIDRNDFVERDFNQTETGTNNAADMNNQ